MIRAVDGACATAMKTVATFVLIGILMVTASTIPGMPSMADYMHAAVGVSHAVQAAAAAVTTAAAA